MMDYSKIDSSVKQDIADRVAFAVAALENLAFIDMPDYASDRLMKVRLELIQLVKDLGGSPII